MAEYTVTSNPAFDLADTGRFIESLPADFFTSCADIVVARAPGRLDLMGGIADYSGSLVLQLPISNAVHVALQKSEHHRIQIVSLSGATTEDARRFEIDLAELHPSRLVDYRQAREIFNRQPGDHWASYVAGVFVVLMRERLISFVEGARILIQSSVPEGKGVSSSAALEVATMQAVSAAYRVGIPPQELALLCQKVENLVVGAACGLMDQMTSACGEPGRLLELLCQPDDLRGTLPLPAVLKVWGIDSGIRHSVAGAGYHAVRTAAFMGYRMIAELAGLRVHHGDRDGNVRIDDPKWNGYLANVTPEEFADFAGDIPEQISGADFLDRYQGITDQVTSVSRETSYPVAAATRHPIHEHRRVKLFSSTLKQWRDVEQAELLGKLMFESHESYSACGLGSEGTDLLVKLVRESGGKDLYGAKITGGGSGGTVAVLGNARAEPAMRSIAERYHEITGYEPIIIEGSSPGAHAFGSLRVRKNT